MDAHHVPLSQSAEGKGRGKGREGGWVTRTKTVCVWTHLTLNENESLPACEQHIFNIGMRMRSFHFPCLVLTSVQEGFFDRVTSEFIIDVCKTAGMIISINISPVAFARVSFRTSSRLRSIRNSSCLDPPVRVFSTRSWESDSFERSLTASSSAFLRDSRTVRSGVRAVWWRGNWTSDYIVNYFFHFRFLGAFEILVECL